MTWGGRRDEPDVELAGADLLGEARQIGEVGAVRLHPDEDEPQAGGGAPPNLVQKIERAHQPGERGADPDRLVGLRSGAVHRHADRLDPRLADRLRLGRSERQQIGGEPEVRDAVAPRLADDVDELRMHQGLGGASEGDAVGAREQVGRDLAEGIERHHAGARQVPVEGQELQPVDRGEVAHLALQVAALGGVEDDLERSGGHDRAASIALQTPRPELLSRHTAAMLTGSRSPRRQAACSAAIALARGPARWADATRP